MNIRGISGLLAVSVILSTCEMEKNKNENDSTVAHGEMPSLAKDNYGNLHIVYGSGDSLMYSFSSNNGKSFSSPELISILPHLVSSHMRGPQVAPTLTGLVVVACNSSGNIHSYTKDTQGNWIQSQRVNDVDSVAREAFVALAADGLHAVAVWLDLRGNRRNKIFGAVSNDGGKTWSANRMLYASPDSSVCECCKPSAIMRGNDVYVMFRNWLHGNRDLYFIHSVDGGHSFGEAQKLGNESWQLDGCPMDGGGIAISRDGILQTVWNRKGKIYGCEPGKDETQLGIGRNCTMESANGKNIYSWVQNDTIIVMKAGGAGINVGEGQLPLLKELNDDHVICIWQNNKQIHRAVLKL